MRSRFDSVVQTLLSAAAATGAGSAFQVRDAKRTFHAVGATTSSTGAATIAVEVSNKPTPSADADWLTLGTIGLTLGTTQTGDGFASDAPWLHVRGNVTAISGTGANVTLYMGS